MYTQNNNQFNNQYIMQYNVPNPNMIQNNPYKFVILSSVNFNDNETDKIKTFILQAISKYDNFLDISKSIQDNWWKEYGGKWIVGAGEKNKFNMFYSYNKIFGCTIGNYKIVIGNIKN